MLDKPEPIQLFEETTSQRDVHSPTCYNTKEYPHNTLIDSSTCINTKTWTFFPKLFYTEVYEL